MKLIGSLGVQDPRFDFEDEKRSGRGVSPNNRLQATADSGRG
jgi:hypothetical protein